MSCRRPRSVVIADLANLNSHQPIRADLVQTIALRGWIRRDSLHLLFALPMATILLRFHKWRPATWQEHWRMPCTAGDLGQGLVLRPNGAAMYPDVTSTHLPSRA